MINEIENLKKIICDLHFSLAVSNKALEIACNEQDLYWFELHALHENVTLVEYIKNMAINELNNNIDKGGN